MFNFILIGVCLLAGFLSKKYNALPTDSFKSVNAWIINIALPAVALRYIPEVNWNYTLIIPFLMPVVVWTGSYLFVHLISKWTPMSPATRGAMILTAGLGNTSFLGFPLTEAYYGEAGLQIAILCDQACFIVMATFGIVVATKASNAGKFEPKRIVRKIIRFPPFIAFCLAFILPLFFSLRPLEPLLSALGLTLVPLALFSVGLQLQLKSWKTDLNLITAVLSYKLILAPLLVLLLCVGFGYTAFISKISIFEAAMAPMVTGVIIATDYDLNPKLANTILSIGIPISFLTTFLWSLLLSFL